MTDDERPEVDDLDDVLAGLDRARPLPAQLRERLTEQLLAATSDEPASRPLEAALTARLSEALAAPAPAPITGRRWATWPRLAVGAAAVVALALAVVAVAIRHPAAGPHVAAGVSAATASLPTSSVAGTLAPAGSASGPARQTPAALAPGPAQIQPDQVNAPTASATTELTTGPPPPVATGAASLAPGAPAVTSVAPAQAPVTGGTRIVINGRNLGGVTTVSFGGTAAKFTVVSPSEVDAIAPAHPPGTVDVTVSSASGSSAVGTADRFTFVPA